MKTRLNPSSLLNLGYPFLFSFYAVLFYTTHNIREITHPLVVTLTVLSVVLFTFILYLIINSIYSEKAKASLALFIFVFFFFAYGNIRDWLYSLWPNSHLELLLVVFVSTVFAATFLLLKFKATVSPRLGVAFSIPLLTLIVVQFFTLAHFAITNSSDTKTNGGYSTVVTLSPTEMLPDIYYLIFDKYSGNRSLTKLYNFDNSAFLQSLTDRGFYVATQSTANYPATFPSVTSSLNLDYLPSLRTDAGLSANDSPLLNSFLENNRVALTLKQYGYNYHHIGSWWQFDAENKHADVSYLRGSSTFTKTQFARQYLLDTTLLSPFLHRTLFSENYDQIVLRQESALIKASESSGHPKFVFMHVISPHPPYVFDENCAAPSTETLNSQLEEMSYINQMRCINTKILMMVDTIKRNSVSPPIIIIQSDEGMRIAARNQPSETEGSTGKDLDADKHPHPYIEEKFPILNAYFFPDQYYQALYPTITPVNTFRLVFNSYLGAKLPLLEDRNYTLDDYYTIHGYEDVTDQVRALY